MRIKTTYNKKCLYQYLERYVDSDYKYKKLNYIFRKIVTIKIFLEMVLKND